jgi:alkanesulfonate monooxygenase SsuD/methylene tetrahydromethanopterin reductase-like flavin-dependent oxidoreductase (luciferase family)
VYANYEPLITLAAVAGVTERVRLVTTVLIAPLRSPGILAKESASLDALSGGRLTLGLGVGNREDDFLAASASFRDRGKRFDQQLETMARVWSAGSFSQDVGPIGPAPAQAGGPEVLIGAYSPAGMQRLGRWGNGYIAGGAGAQQARQFFELAQKIWQEAGRPGKPRLVGCSYFALGPDAAEGANKSILSYYAFRGAGAQQLANNVPASPGAVSSTIRGYADLGADEVILWPCIPELDQIDRLADLVTSV